MYTKLEPENPKGRDNLGYLGVDMKIILKLFLKEAECESAD
jgi:hypothetical protein